MLNRDILLLFLTLGRKFSVFPYQGWYYPMIFNIYTSSGWGISLSFLVFQMFVIGSLDFVKFFFASIEIIMCLLSFILLICVHDWLIFIFKISLHFWDKPNLVVLFFVKMLLI